MATSQHTPDGRPGLRERKKQQTAEAIRHSATTLFLQQGYDGTTVEEIAGAANVSVSTFFRYFPTKEAVLLRTADGAKVVRRALEARADDEPLWTCLSRGLVLGLPELIDFPTEELERIRIAYSTESVRGAIAAAMALMREEIGREIRPYLPRGKDGDLRAQVIAGALCGAIEATQYLYVNGGARGDAFALLAQAFEMYGTGLDQIEG